MTPPDGSPFLRRLRAAVIEEMQPEIDLACQVATLKTMGFKNGEIASMTGATGTRFKQAMGRAAGAASRIELPELPL